MQQEEIEKLAEIIASKLESGCSVVVDRIDIADVYTFNDVVERAYEDAEDFEEETRKLFICEASSFHSELTNALVNISYDIAEESIANKFKIGYKEANCEHQQSNRLLH